MNILIIGGTGFLGKALTQSFLENGHSISVLSRHPERMLIPGVKMLGWNGREIVDEASVFDWVINLAGAGIADKRWTPAYRKIILDSRVQSTRACVNYIKRSGKVKVFICASAAGYYGAGTEVEVNELSPPGTDFLAQVCQAWESEANEAPTRTINLRTTVVLGKGGGALGKMLPLFRIGLGGWLGNGRQAFPWIHVKDVCSAINFLAENADCKGPFNLVSPDLIPNRDFSRKLASALRRPCLFPVPAWVLRMVLGERADLILKGQLVIPQALEKAGYQFIYPKLENALADIVS